MLDPRLPAPGRVLERLFHGLPLGQALGGVARSPASDGAIWDQFKRIVRFRGRPTFVGRS